MHGRVKIRTTEEQEKIKKQEREKKMGVYKIAMAKLTTLRTSKSYNNEGLDITANVLVGNPDILTVWNYRREILLAMKQDLDSDDFQKLLEKDLNLTEQCLRVNPKSYGSWHHRTWILCNMPDPNWERELLLCKRYLQLDERNFHCWDYRRFLTQMSNVPDIAEYEFTLEKIENNFSNYSAWHLRSKLLPKIFPDVENNLPINEMKHKEELELVQNAAFTDPNDQSAWLYQRWLLGLTEPKIHFVNAQVDGNKIIAGMSTNLCQNSQAKCNTFIKVESNGEELNGLWESSSKEIQSSVWILNLENDITESIPVSLHLIENGVTIDTMVMNEIGCFEREPNFVAKLSPSLKEVLINQLSSCQQLLELEPDSRWTILTSLRLMESIDVIHYKKEIENHLKKLIEIDSLRQGYYQDLYSKHEIECAIIQHHKNNNGMKFHSSKFTIGHKNLTCLYRMQYLLFVEDIDLSNNSLTSEILFSLHCLINCKRLNLDNNKITNLKCLPVLQKLEFLSLYNNSIETSSLDHLKSFVSLREFYI